MSHGRSCFSVGHSAISLSLSLLVVLLAGCAAAPTRWVHPDRPKDKVDADLTACETIARSQVVRPQAPPPAVNFTGLASVFSMMSDSRIDREYQAEVDRQVKQCLQKKGWRTVN
ncbi:MAG: hypothetical protein FGM18_02495 [Burkholderiaceae bacterium]|nr:hypothetical protein [Burkholderiaceae bacterium]